MADYCYLEMTLRRADLPRFAPFVHGKPDGEWWDGTEPTIVPGLITLYVYEANYAWGDPRLAAAKEGIPFYGTHSEGGEYGPYAFVSLDNEQIEVPLSHEGELFIAVDDNLKPIDDSEGLRAYAAKLKAVKRLFGITEDRDNGRGQQESAPADQQAERPAVPAGLCAA